ncbi:hypothetical protein [Pseudomonas phoenicis]|uniref:hypothetical protein n=1 Tax=unclassified Pseudomonas TaxID=196821 RepID=UPI0039A2C3EB
MADYERKTTQGLDHDSALDGWPFLVCYEKAVLDSHWRAHPIQSREGGFAARSLRFETATSSTSAQYVNCTLGDMRLQTRSGSEFQAFLVVRRRFLDGATVDLHPYPGASTRLITEIRRFNEAVATDLCLEIPLHENQGQYDGQRVIYGWALRPQFFWDDDEGKNPDTSAALPYALYFKSLPQSEQFIELADSLMQRGNVLKPLDFKVYPSKDFKKLVLNPMVSDLSNGVFAPDYPPYASAIGTPIGLLLDQSVHPSASLTAEDLQTVPGLFMPLAEVQGCTVRDEAPVVVAEFALQDSPSQSAEPVTESFSLEPLVTVIEPSQTPTFTFTASSPGTSEPEWVLLDGGKIDPDGWRCRYRPRPLRGSSTDESSTVGTTLWTVSEVDEIKVRFNDQVFTSWAVVLRRPPNGYIRLIEMVNGAATFNLCFTGPEGEVRVPLNETIWACQNCDINSMGVMSHWGSNPVCIIRAYRQLDNQFIWGVLVVPYPLFDIAQAMSLGIA